MRLENVLALTNAKLVNEPFVKQFTNIIFDENRVKRGDLFIAFDEEAIETAVFNGAYGVMFDRPTQISDSEIAWIKVDNLVNALKRLLRFRLIEKDIIVYECNEIILKLALQIMTESNFIVLDGDIESITKELWDLEGPHTVLFSPFLISKDIFTDIKSIPSSKEPISIMEQTLFETSFIYDDVFYERQLISPFFIPYLSQLLHLFKILKINFRLKKFNSIGHFEAVFTNKNFEIKDFGTSDKVLIFEKSVSLIKNEINFLQKQATWAKIIYILPFTCKDSLDINSVQSEIVFLYKNEN
jgi:ferrochelatase